MEQLPLEQPQVSSEDKYIIDTSSLVDVGLEANSSAIWRGVFGLVTAGKLFTVGYVFPELERMVAADKLPAVRYERLLELKTLMVIPDEELILEAGKVNYKYPKLGDWRDRRNRADPWIVAAGIVRGYKVVTEERDTGREKTHRIPWVCDQEGVEWLRLSRLISAEKLRDSA